MRTLAYKCLACLGCLLACILGAPAHGQVAGPGPVSRDSTDIIHLLNADELIGIQAAGPDSSQLQKLNGNVLLRQGQTLFSCDSATQNLTLNTIDAYGHIHINQADTIHTYSNFLHYEANTKVATLKDQVRMTDGQMVLTTNLLNYDMNAHIGNFLNGGKLVTGNTVLLSKRGYYYADTKDVYFKDQVDLTDPEYTLVTDTLRYNTTTRIATFVAPTTINTGGTIIHTSCGFYNTLENFAHLCNRSTVIDSSQRLTADSLDFNRNTGIGIALGNVVWTDTAQQMTVLANYAISDQNKSTILATQKPLLILERETDTLFWAADTLFSGPLVATPVQEDTAGAPAIDSASVRPVIPSRDSLKSPADTAAIPRLETAPDTLIAAATDSITANGLPFAGTTTTGNRKEDTAGTTQEPPAIAGPAAAGDSLQLPPAAASGKDRNIDTAVLPPAPTDSLKPGNIPDSVNTPLPENEAGNSGEDTVMRVKTLPPPGTDSLKPQAAGDTTTLRYVMAFHHVRLYSDSLQGVSDSLYYSDVDSAFHFYGDPVLWTGTSQLTGDTIVLTTRNQQADRILLQQHAMIINQSGPGLFNQIKGANITGYFTDRNQLSWMRVDGNAESMYYAQDDNGAYVGANRSTSAMIRMYFKDGQLDKVVLLKDVDGSFLPPTKVPEEDQKLRGFRWLEDRRPKSRASLMR